MNFVDNIVLNIYFFSPGTLKYICIIDFQLSKSMKIKNNLLLIFTLTSIFPLIIVTLMFNLNSENLVKMIIGSQLQAGLESISRSVGNKIASFKNQLVPVTSLEVFLEKSELSDEEWERGLKTTLGNYYLQETPYISSISVSDINTNKVYSIERVVVSESGHSPYVSTKNLDERLHNVRGITLETNVKSEYTKSLGYLIYISRGIINKEGEIWGWINIEINLTKIITDLAEKNSSQYPQYLFVSDLDNNSIISLVIDKGTAGTVFQRNSMIDQSLNIQKSGSVIEYQDNSWLTASILNEEYGFILTSMMLIEPYEQEIKSKIIFFTLFILLIGVTILILTVSYSSRFSNKINEMKTAAQNISDGEFNTKIENISNDELGDLSKSINEMAVSLDEYFEKIKVMTQKVAEKDKLDELNKLKSRFVSMTSHELKTPLTTIKWTLDNLKSGIYGELSNEQKVNIENLERTSEHLVRTVENLLDLSKIEAGIIELIFKKYPVSTIIDEAIYFSRSFSESKNIRIRKELDKDSDLELVCDKDKIVNILRNLMDNAVKFSPENSEIIANVSSTEGFLNIRITDYGCGIPDNDRINIFQPFFKVRDTEKKSKGLGLGLSIVNTLVDLHRGSIVIDSTVGKGSIFTIIIPTNLEETYEEQSIDN